MASRTYKFDSREFPTRKEVYTEITLGWCRSKLDQQLIRMLNNEADGCTIEIVVTDPE